MAELTGVVIVMQHYPPRIQNEIPLDEISRIIRISEAKSSGTRKNNL